MSHGGGKRERPGGERLGAPRLETERLHLRVLTPADAPAVREHFADEAVTRFMDIEPCRSLDEAQEIIRFHADDSGCRWGLFDKATGALVGTCGFHCWEQGEDSSAEVGFDLGQVWQGRGLATETLRAAVRFGFDIMRLDRIDAEVEPENQRSIALLERLGFNRELVVPGAPLHFRFLRSSMDGSEGPG